MTPFFSLNQDIQSENWTNSSSVCDSNSCLCTQEWELQWQLHDGLHLPVVLRGRKRSVWLQEERVGTHAAGRRPHAASASVPRLAQRWAVVCANARQAWRHRPTEKTLRKKISLQILEGLCCALDQHVGRVAPLQNFDDSPERSWSGRVARMIISIDKAL